MKQLGEDLSIIEITFFRFLISTVLVLFPMFVQLSKGTNLFKTSMPKFHITRGLLGAIALICCCLGVNCIPMAENTVILFSESLFLLPLSVVFLKEKIRPRAIIATIFGFLGLLVIMRPQSANINYFALIPTFAALLFAIMDIMIKKMVDKNENQITMLFYFGLVSTICASILLPFLWIPPTFTQTILLIILGLGANLIQICLFMVFKVTEANILSPLRYTELIFSTLFGFLLFDQIPGSSTMSGAALIVFSTLLLSK